MSLNDIHLTPQLLADLYGNTLIEANTATPSPTGPRYLGNNEKHIVVLVRNEELPFLQDNELNFLTNILNACRMSLSDIALLNIEGIEPPTVQEAIVRLEANYVLMFGTGPLSAGLPINFPHFQRQLFDKRTYLFSPAFSELEKDKLLKSKLWNSLKLLFNL